MTAVDLSTAIRGRAISCREVMAAHLNHIAVLKPGFNEVASRVDRGSLLAEAGRADAGLASGIIRGWMHGFPHAVKDPAATKAVRTTLDSPLSADQVPQVDAIFVERLKAAGAIVIGKTNTPEFGLGSQTCNPVFETTLNAYDPAKTAGGGSGGTAMVLAFRMVPIADGGDFEGSLRNPAGWDDVCGFRPSAGRVPHGPGDEVLLTQLATERPMARNPADLAMLHRLPDALTSSREINKPRTNL